MIHHVGYRIRRVLPGSGSGASLGHDTQRRDRSTGCERAVLPEPTFEAQRPCAGPGKTIGRQKFRAVNQRSHARPLTGEVSALMTTDSGFCLDHAWAFATPAQALADMEIANADIDVPSLDEAEDEIGISGWIDPEIRSARRGVRATSRGSLSDPLHAQMSSRARAKAPAAPKQDAFRAGREAMLRDIADEVAWTRQEIGKEALDARVMAALAKVPRELFVPAMERRFAFANGPLPIGHGQTISQPYIVALMTDLLEPRPDSVILEIGTGSGYQTAVLAELVHRVYSVEIIAALAAEAQARLRRLGYDNVFIRHGDGWQGWPEHAPYDGIIVTAAAPQLPPALLEQLKPGGRLVIPIGAPGDIQQLKVVSKRADASVSQRDVLRVAFVPMTRELR